VRDDPHDQGEFNFCLIYYEHLLDYVVSSISQYVTIIRRAHEVYGPSLSLEGPNK